MFYAFVIDIYKYNAKAAIVSPNNRGYIPKVFTSRYSLN